MRRKAERKGTLREEIYRVLAEAYEGSRRIRVVLKKDALDSLLTPFYIHSFHESGVIKMDEPEKIKKYMKLNKQKWENDTDRTIDFTIIKLYPDDVVGLFVETMERTIESIQAIN